MWRCFAIVLALCFLGNACGKDPNIEEEELEGANFMRGYNKKQAEQGYRLAIASWNYASNLTEANLNKQLELAAEIAKEDKEDWKKLIQYDWSKFSQPLLKRQFKKAAILGGAALPEDKFKKLNKIVSDMQAIYSKAKICDYNDKSNCNLSLEPELTKILAKSRNEKELKHVWVEYRNTIGPHCRNSFKEYVDLNNEAARLNNVSDTGDFWLLDYEDPNIKQQVNNLWEQLKPLYLQIHAYVRNNLRKQYGNDVVSEKGPIPAHLLGNMWSQVWNNVKDFTLPYKNVPELDLTKSLVEKGYTPVKIFREAEAFFKSINLTEMPESFWENSILEKPKDRDIICHASAWDFRNGKDFRIKQCTEVTKEHFITAHHEMGHIEYFLQYKDQPNKFREGANEGFHEAVGDLIALSVSSNKHLKKLGLIGADQTSKEAILNNLYSIGLDKIAILPFAYLMDLWRWDIFSGKTNPDDYNCKWWELREKYQGIEPPVDRSEEDFDPAAKYHIIADVPYLRYFVANVIQFQFHQALCEKAGQYEPNNPNKPLHECDIYENTEAGNVLKEMLSLGSSKPWPEAMKLITGQSQMDASGLLEYFKPIHKWLQEENLKNGVFIGWEKSKKVCTRSRKD